MASKAEAGSDFDDVESWIMIDDIPENSDALDESVLNPVSARSRAVSNLVQKMRKLKPKRSTSYGEDPVRRKGETEGRPQASDNRPRGGIVGVFGRLRSRSSTLADGGQKQQGIQGERFACRQNSTPEILSPEVTTQYSIKHTPSEPVMVRSELSESLPTLPSHRVPPQDTATALGTSVVTDTCTTAKVYDELKAKDRELAALELKLEMKDQEGHKHKLNVEKLTKQIEQLTDQRVQQSISCGQKVEKVRQEGKMKMLQMKQQLKEEQAKSKLKADEIAELRRKITEVAQQQSVRNHLKVAEVRQEGEKRILKMKQQLAEEQTEVKRREEEITKLRRQIDKVAFEQVQQTISGDQKVKEVKQEGEKKVSQMKQQLREERKQKEEEIDLLKRQLEELQLQVVQQDDTIESQEELLRSFQASQQQVRQQMDPTHNVDLKSITIDFANRMCARLIAQHPVVSGLVDDLARSCGVKVNITVAEDKASLMQATLTGSQKDIDHLKNEILSLYTQLQFDLETQKKELHSMYAPLFLTERVADALAEIEESRLLEISVVEHGKAYLSIDEFSLHLKSKIAENDMVRVTDLVGFRTTTEPILVNFEWKMKYSEDQDVPLDREVQQQLTDFFNTSKDHKITVLFKGEQFVADVTSLKLIRVKTGESFTLIREVQQPVWYYCLDTKKFVEHTAADSQALENLYRYGGSFITLAGEMHTLDLTKMQQINLSTGEGVTVKRYPTIAHSKAPEFTISIAVRGLSNGLDSALKAVQDKLQSFLCSCTFTNEFVHCIPEEWQEIILVQVKNAAREYCLKVGSSGVQNERLTIQLRGARDVVDRVQVILKEYCLELQQYVLSQISYVFEQKIQLTSASNYPREWEPQQTDIEQFDIQKGSGEWNKIYGLMKHTIPTVNMVHLKRIQNRKLWDKYALERKHMSERNGGDAQVNEKLLFHGTRGTDPQTIIISPKGIDFRYSRRDYQLLWGTGAYFAVNASYSDNYCYVDQKLRVKQLLLVKVLTGNSCSYGTRNDPDLTKPPPLTQGNPLLYDTVNGFTNGSCVYIVYDHDKAYPAYLISYLS